MKKAVVFIFLSLACAYPMFPQTASQMARQRAAGRRYGTPNQSATRNYYRSRQNTYPAARTARPPSRPYYRSYGARNYGRAPIASPYAIKTYKVVQGANYTSDASKLEAFLNRMLSLGWKFRGTTGSFLIFYK